MVKLCENSTQQQASIINLDQDGFEAKSANQGNICCELANFTSSPALPDRETRVIGQRILVPYNRSHSTEAVRALIEKAYISGVIVTIQGIGEAVQASRLIGNVQRLARSAGHAQPLLIGSHPDNGWVSKFPSPVSLAAGRSTVEISRIGEAIGRELSSIGVNWYLVPTVNNATALTEPLVASERFSDDVQAVSHYAAAFLEGFSASGVACCPKVDVTATLQEVYRANGGPDLEMEETLKREDVQPLRHAVGTEALNSLLLTAPFDQVGDVSRAGASYQKIIQQLVRQQLRYQGLLVSDCSQTSTEADYCVIHGPLRALLSGSDMVILPSDYDDQVASIRAIHAAARSSHLPTSATMEAVERIRSFKAKHIVGPNPSNPSIDRTQHAALAQEAYRHSTTALSTTASPLIDLPATSILLLLTPSVPPLSTSAFNPDSDPFEPLGRALADIHPRTRHVPYTLSTGLTSTHSAFLDRAAAVVLVLCNPSSAFEESQEELISAVQSQLRTHESTSGAQKVGKVVLAAGDPKDLNQPLEGWWEVCCYEYTPGALKAAAEVITGQRTATGRLPVKLSRYLGGNQ